MKRFFLFLMIIFNLSHSYGQTDSASVYKNLKTKKFYAVNTRAYNKGKKMIYEVNGNRVTKSKYTKYHSTGDNLVNCCPCILESYDVKDNLISKSVSCGDCAVGWFQIYYPNGNLKLTGTFKENSTGKWNNVSKLGLCNVSDGEWIYFTESGDTLYSEFWTNGEFIKQVPEQETTEIWSLELKLDEKTINTQSIEMKHIGELIVNPKYKNGNSSANLSITFRVSAIGYRASEDKFTLESFKKIDVESMLSAVGIPKDKKTTFELCVLNNDAIIKCFYLNVER